jgi:hypothetical protein
VFSEKSDVLKVLFKGSEGDLIDEDEESSGAVYLKMISKPPLRGKIPPSTLATDTYTLESSEDLLQKKIEKQDTVMGASLSQEGNLLYLLPVYLQPFTNSMASEMLDRQSMAHRLLSMFFSKNTSSESKLPESQKKISWYVKTEIKFLKKQEEKERLKLDETTREIEARILSSIKENLNFNKQMAILQAVTLELTLIKMHKLLKVGLEDKSIQELSNFRLANAKKAEAESDCCVCFSSAHRENNPIIYCSGKQYSSLIQLSCSLPPSMLSDQEDTRGRFFL